MAILGEEVMSDNECLHQLDFCQIFPFSVVFGDILVKLQVDFSDLNFRIWSPDFPLAPKLVHHVLAEVRDKKLDYSFLVEIVVLQEFTDEWTLNFIKVHWIAEAMDPCDDAGLTLILLTRKHFSELGVF